MKNQSVVSSVMTTANAAAYLGLGLSSLEKYRIYGGGPRFAKLGRRVVYKPADLDRWVEERIVGSTSEADSLPKSKDPRRRPRLPPCLLARVEG